MSSVASLSDMSFPGAIITKFIGLDSAGNVYGLYFDSYGNEHSFIRRRGIYQNIDAPDAISTSVKGFNDAGYVWGSYTDLVGDHSFYGLPGSYSVVALGRDGCIYIRR